MSVLEIQPAVDLQVWEQFQSGAFTLDQISQSRLLQRWQRSLELGLSGVSDAPPMMSLEGLARSLERFAPVLAPGAPFDAFASEMARAGFSGLLCDADGVILARQIAEPFQTRIARTHLVEGAVWSERARGTNGVGTALAEEAPATVVGAEHYEYRNHGLACYAAPVRDVRERVVAVLDASGPASAGAPHLLASVVATAAAIEALIIARTYEVAVPGGLFEIERLLERLPHAGLVMESTGRVRRSNQRLRSMVPDAVVTELTGQLRGRSAPPTGRAAGLSTALRHYAVELEPLGDPKDPFASLVHLKPRASMGVTRRISAPPSAAFATVIGSDPALSEARARAERFAVTDLAVLLQAETGTGKELFARAIHAASARADGPFVPVNCGAITPTLIESELFGYGPGAFTGASAGGRTGKLAAADRGTLFLDEIGEMSPAAQATLLRFLEDGTFYRVGEATECRADVRLVTATSRDLSALVAEGRFRSDLYFRIRGVVLRLPPLRSRGDRRELATALLGRIARDRALPKPLGLSPGALEWIEQHDWPGNVRELRTALEYAVVLAGDAPRIERWHLPIEEAGEPVGRGDLRATSERSALVRALEDARGNLSDAARTLGVARSTLYRMMTRHGLRGRGD